MEHRGWATQGGPWSKVPACDTDQPNSTEAVGKAFYGYAFHWWEVRPSLHPS